jgi:hypothetical protein
MTVVHLSNQDRSSPPASSRRFRIFRRFCLVCTVLLALGIGALAVVRINRNAMQWHQDPSVGTVWVAGVSYGARPTLSVGSPLVRWLNRHGIQAFGKAETLVSRFHGDEGGLEIWFGCRSKLAGKPLLECHRVGKTAFTDDLGQEYQGYLDFQGAMVGVYLPGYDHAARRLTCALHWMPRAPADPAPISAPMQFTIDLPPATRQLPEPEQLAGVTSTQTRQGITVTAGNVRLEAPKLSTTVSSQRDLIFHLDVRGGTLACSNMETLPGRINRGASSAHAASRELQITSRDLQAARLVAPWNAPPPPQNALQITDPYGVSLLASREQVVPMMSLDATRCTQEQDGAVWIAPVNSAGQGANVIHLRLYIQPANPQAPPVPFDFTLPVRTDTEI